MTRARYPVVLVVLAAFLGVSMVAGIAIGSVAVAPLDVVTAVLHRIVPDLVASTGPEYVDALIATTRGPRVVVGAVVGAGLATVGMVLQALVRNPLADPYLLGVSSGASVGAVMAILSGAMVFGVATTSIAAFLGALVALLVVYFVARAGGRITTIGLVLAGVAVAYVLSALTSLMLLLADSAQHARQVLTWLLGGLGGSTWASMWLPLTAVCVGLVLLMARARALNLLYAGEDAAVAMGLDVSRFRAWMFVLTSVLTGLLVAVSGPIGFVGLILPHAVRLVVGSDHRRALPAAALAGASFLVLADIVARTVASPQEIPVGVFTALCGGPFFLWLVRRQARRGAAA
ncbi:ABC transporter permease [Actinosynnema sp. ALI-1.44]|uniref:FecCD family ABC transporter permease n=1 Tax=Actinosynnema sp. ALI-1.44 TaxID=1933779 RepID=UPI00097C710C|nr:iron ABC transporter permease [Actinosynnema sp. ALI-1.44]ONI84100.1 ABC transporter permease [Actinosynnema sp. ALI-1.44]